MRTKLPTTFIFTLILLSVAGGHIYAQLPGLILQPIDTNYIIVDSTNHYTLERNFKRIIQQKNGNKIYFNETTKEVILNEEGKQIFNRTLILNRDKCIVTIITDSIEIYYSTGEYKTLFQKRNKKIKLKFYSKDGSLLRTEKPDFIEQKDWYSFQFVKEF